VSKKTSIGATVLIPSELHAQFKDIIKSKGQTLRFVVIQLIKEYIQKEGK